MTSTTVRIAEPGSIIHGTHEDRLLIEAFMGCLEDHDPVTAESIRDEYGAAFIEKCCTPHGMDYPLTGEQDQIGWLFESLYDALDLVAPNGHYFGAHPGDGADFGFWVAEDHFGDE